MAEARIDLKVYGTSAIKEATKSIVDLGVANEKLDKIYDAVAAAEARRIKEVDKLAALQKRLAKEVEAGTISEQRANRVMDQAVRTSMEKVHTDQRLVKQLKEKHKEQEKAERLAQKEIETNNRARAQYDQIYVAQVRLKQAQEDINRAVAAGMSQELASQRLEELTRDYQAWIAAVESGDYAMINSGNQFARFNDNVFRAQQRVKRFASVGLQQAGYQIQDFIVQVSAGQSALVAFGQQGSQLAGIIPGHWGAITGAILAGASAAILALQALKGEAKTVQENFNNLAQAFGDFTSAMDKASAPDFFDQFQSFADTAERALKAIQGLAKAQINDSIRQVMGGEVRAVSSFSRQEGRNVERFTTGDIRQGANLLGVGIVTKEDLALVNQYLTLLSSMQQAQGFDDQARAAGELNKFLEANVDLNKLSKTERENIVALMEQTLNLAEQAAKPEAEAAEQAKIAYGAKLQAALDLFDAEQALLQAQYADDAKKAEEAKAHRDALRMQMLQSTIDSHMQAYEAETALQQAALQDYMEKKAEKRKADKELSDKRIEDGSRELNITEQLFADVQESLAAVAEKQEAAMVKFLEKVVAAKNDAEKLSKIDIASGINAAAIEASNLSESMKKALMDALGIVQLSKDAMSLSPFGPGDGEGDPFYSTPRTFNPIDEDKEGARAAERHQKQLESYMESLMTEQEQVEEWRNTQLELLQQFNNKELEMIGGQAGAKLRIEQEYRNKLLSLVGKSSNQERDMVFDSGIQILNALGQFNDKALKIARVASAAKALINTYEGASQALKLPFPYNLAAAASVISAGLGFVASIKSATSSSSSPSRIGSASITSPSISTPSMPAAQASTGTGAAGPQRVIIEGINRDTLITGEQLSNIFDQLYKENEDRGFVFEVAQ